MAFMERCHASACALIPAPAVVNPRFTMLYHFSLNWEEHWYGDIWVFEKDVQMNGWGDEGHEHGHH